MDLKNRKGQISLEFLIIITIMISILVLFMPIFVKVYNATLLSLDVYNAKNFISNFSTKVENLNVLENESYFTISIKPISNYEIKCNESKLSIKSFLGDDKNFEKILETELALDCDYENIIADKLTLKIIKKSENEIIIEEI
jgi:uncharacterized protein (UPF0333 family)